MLIIIFRADSTNHQVGNMKIFLCLIFAVVLNIAECHNKYSAAANAQAKDTTVPPSSLRTLDKPFRMAKINNYWAKAQIVSILIPCID